MTGRPLTERFPVGCRVVKTDHGRMVLRTFPDRAGTVVGYGTGGKVRGHLRVREDGCRTAAYHSPLLWRPAGRGDATPTPGDRP